MPLNRGAMTDMGRMRKNNEDRYLIAGRLAAVADGMGGHRAGEVASAIAMEELATLEHAGPWPTPAEAGEALRAVFLAANRRIRETAAKDAEFEGMGTTLVALLEDGDSVHLANVGDSRNVLLRVPEPQRAAEKLVAMANEGGGPDNITVVVLDTSDRLGRAGERTGDLDTPTGAIAHGRDGATSELLTGLHHRVATGDGMGSRAQRRQAERMRPAARGARASRHSRRRGLRRALVSLLVLAVLAAVLLGGRALVFSRYWVGFDHDQVAVFSGVPGNVAGLRLSRVVERTGITRDRVAAGYAPRLDEGVSASGLADARRIARCSPFVFTQQGCATGTQAAPTTTAVPTTTKRVTTTTKKG